MENEAIVSRVRAALDVLDNAEVPAELRPSVIRDVYSDLRQPAGSTRSAPGDGSAVRLAHALGVEPTAVERVYDFDDDGVHLIVARAGLDRGKAAAMREVAVLIVAARQKIGVEEWTPLDIVRDQCESRGVLDNSNFSTEIKRLDGHGMRFRGGPRSREVKMNQVGFDEAATLIRRLAGGES